MAADADGIIRKAVGRTEVPGNPIARVWALRAALRRLGVVPVEPPPVVPRRKSVGRRPV